MSLDVTLRAPPHRCEHCGKDVLSAPREAVYSANITHNLGNMAGEAGIYCVLWRPEELGWSKAKNLIPALSRGLELLKADPKGFRKFNAPNGWGVYENFVSFVEKYLEACIANPDADVEVIR